MPRINLQPRAGRWNRLELPLQPVQLRHGFQQRVADGHGGSIEPRHAVAYHFSNDPDTLPLIVDAVRQTYSGPVDFAQDFMVWNVTKQGIRTRLGVANPNRYPLPPMGEKQLAETGARYETPEWIWQGLEPGVRPVIQKIYDDFNEEFGTSIANPLAE